MIAIAVSVTITVALSFGITRYRAPVDVVLPVLAAVAVDALWRRRDRAPADAATDAASSTTGPVDTAALPVSATSERS
jgi:hypothetical protein